MRRDGAEVGAERVRRNTARQAADLLLRKSLDLPVDLEALKRADLPDRFVQLTEQTGLCGHIMRTLRLTTLHTKELQDLEAALRPAFIRHSAAALKAHNDGLAVLEALQSAGIQCLPFKGTFLSERLFGDPLVRRSGDIDIILPEGPDTAEDAAGVLEGLSYRFPFKSPVLRDFHRRVYGQMPLVSEGKATVDLHYAPRDDLPPDAYRQVFRRASGSEGKNGRPGAIESLDLLLLLCAHYWTVHRSEHLAWLLDLAALVRSGEPFGEGWEERVASWRMEFQLAAALAAMGFEFGLAPGGGVGEALRGRLNEKEKKVCLRIKEGGVGALPSGMVRKVHRLGFPWPRRIELLVKHVWPHPGRIMQEEGERRGTPGVQRRLGFAFRRFKAGLSMR